MTTLIDSKKIMHERRVALSKEVCEKISVREGDILSFVEEDGRVYIKKAVA